MSVAVKSAPRRLPVSDPAPRPALRVVAPPRRRFGQAVFVLTCAALLVGGLVAVLWLNTTMAADAFEKHQLEENLADFAEQQAMILERLNDHEAPASLADDARELGMMPGTGITYVRLSDGTTIGQPVAAGEEAEMEGDGVEGVEGDGVEAEGMEASP
ncbi:MAG: hypothetical protein LBK72_09355 [Bifidobacteriaceae bacterium]|jgi:hypothetical protein|nr:hypothetical protein [Bifidobacteriaceae bacterium]